MKRLFSFALAAILAVGSTTISFADDLELHPIEGGYVDTDDSTFVDVVTVDGEIEPYIDSDGSFNIRYYNDNQNPKQVVSDRFDAASDFISIRMSVENLLPKEPLNRDYVRLTLYGPGCGLGGTSANYKIGTSGVAPFDGLTEGEEYYFIVTMWDWVEIDGKIMPFEW